MLKDLLWVVPIGQRWAHLVNTKTRVSLCERYSHVMDSGRNFDNSMCCEECLARYGKNLRADMFSNTRRKGGDPN